MRAPMRLFLRFSLQTLMLGVLFAGCAGLLWKNREPWRVVLRLPEHRNDVKTAQFSRDGTRVMTMTQGPNEWPQRADVDRANRIFVWNADSAKLLFQVEGGFHYATFGGGGVATFSPGGKWLYMHSASGTGEWEKIWNGADGQALQNFKNEEITRCYGISPDDRWIVTFEYFKPGIFVIDTHSGCQFPMRGPYFSSPKFSSDGRHAVSVTKEFIRLLIPSNWESEKTIPIHPKLFEHCAAEIFSPDGNMIAFERMEPDGPSDVYILNLRTEQWLEFSGKLPGAPCQFRTPACFSPDCRRIILIDTSNKSNYQAGVWAIRERKKLFDLPTSGYQWWLWTYSADGKRIIGDDAQAVRAYDADTGAALKFQMSDLRAIHPEMFSGDGKKVIVSSTTSELIQASYNPPPFGMARKIPPEGMHRNAEIREYVRPEEWWGIAWLVEFWVAVLVLISFLWSIRRDWRSFR